MVILVKIENFEKKALNALLELLKDVPFIRRARTKTARADRVKNKVTPESDLEVIVDLLDENKLLIVETKMNGEPRYARMAANQLYRCREKFPDSYGIFIAPYISPKSAIICREAGIGYVDLAGNCFLNFEKVFISREGRHNQFTEKRQLHSLFTPKANRIVRVLLAHPHRKWKMQSLSNEAEVSLGQVFSIKQMLIDREWLGTDSAGIFLTNPEELLDEFAKNYSYKQNGISDFYSMKPLNEIEIEIDRIYTARKIQYSATGFSGAERYAPSVRYNRIMLFIQDDIELASEALDLKRVETGANVSLLRPYDKGVFYDSRRAGDMMVVSPIQLYVDLKSYPGRGEEAARMILEQVIMPQWGLKKSLRVEDTGRPRAQK